MVNNMTEFHLLGGRTSLLSNSKQQISREPPNRSAAFVYRIHIDVVGRVTPVGRDGERYWIIYTDDYSSHRWTDITFEKDPSRRVS